MTMVDIMSLVKSGGQVSLTVTPDDLRHFAEMLIAESRKEWEEQVASARKEEPEEKYLTAEEVRNYFGVTDATLWNWHRTNYLCHVKFGRKNMYPASAVKALANSQASNMTVSDYCKRKSKVEKELLEKEKMEAKSGKEVIANNG